MVAAGELSEKSEYKKIHGYLRLCLNQICPDCANIHRNHQAVTFDDNHNRNVVPAVRTSAVEPSND